MIASCSFIIKHVRGSVRARLSIKAKEADIIRPLDYNVSWFL
ncbi:hypothetical protein HMPREF3190_00459 [Umbribacter vaginalis]|nr:hypothetical protein HMPREF3190_00459 [Coriobacteriales bacterium DNF00809]